MIETIEDIKARFIDKPVSGFISVDDSTYKYIYRGQTKDGVDKCDYIYQLGEEGIFGADYDKARAKYIKEYDKLVEKGQDTSDLNAEWEEEKALNGWV